MEGKRYGMNYTWYELGTSELERKSQKEGIANIVHSTRGIAGILQNPKGVATISGIVPSSLQIPYSQK